MFIFHTGMKTVHWSGSQLRQSHCKARLQRIIRLLGKDLRRNSKKCVAGLLLGGCNAIHKQAVAESFNPRLSSICVDL
jgi:hypothetical protein